MEEDRAHITTTLGRRGPATGRAPTPAAARRPSGRAAPTGGADAHESLREVLGYVGADVVDPAGLRIPVARDAIGPDGLIADPLDATRVTEALRALAEHAG